MRDMLGRGKAVSVEDALGLIFDSVAGAGIPTVEKPLSNAFGAVLSEDVRSPEDLPGFSRSTVDGYAVVAADTFGASESSPSYLDVSREVLMGEEPDFELMRGEAARIATGGMLPPGADGVLMFEHVQDLGDGSIEVQRAVAPGDNVIRRGEDVRAGEPVLRKGRRLKPQDVAVLAGVGLTGVRVYDSPAVSIISTGDEVVPAGSPLEPGLVRDMNSFSLEGLILRDGGIPLRLGIVRDEHGELRHALREALKRGRMVLMTGGSSVGAKDMAERVVSELGEVVFHGVLMKPGKPMMFGIADGKPVFGLPGHPRAVSVCYDVFIRPLMRLLCGEEQDATAEMKTTVRARLSKSIRSTAGRQEVISVSLSVQAGELWASPVLGKSGLISMLLRADGTITVPAGSPGLQKGAAVDVRLI